MDDKDIHSRQRTMSASACPTLIFEKDEELLTNPVFISKSPFLLFFDFEILMSLSHYTERRITTEGKAGAGRRRGERETEEQRHEIYCMKYTDQDLDQDHETGQD